jgi:alanine racemase
MPRPLTAVISVAALQHNLARAKQCAPGARVWAVVKANAYGHGLACAMRAFSDADGLALIETEAAEQLRALGWTKPILLLEGFFDPSDLPMLAERHIQTAVHCKEQIDMIAGSGLTSALDVHLKMNSGMNRLGFRPETYRQAYEQLRSLPAVRSITLMTHFANADDPRNQGCLLEHQVSCFEEATSGLPGKHSLSNSAGVLMHPRLAHDWIRPGIMLYGGTPGGGTAEEFGLKPAMTLRSEIIGVQTVEAGDAVGYGSRFIAKSTMRIGVVACGYADGYPRHAPEGTPVLVNGRRTVIAGRVSMDMITVDLTDIPDAKVGSSVTLWGDGLPIDEVAGAAGTIGYELMCALAPRVRVMEA